MPEPVVLIRYQQGIASEKEKQEVEDWLSSSVSNQNEMDKVLFLWQQSTLVKGIASIEIEEQWAELLEKGGHSPSLQPNPSGSLFRQYWWLAAAVLAIVIMLVGLLIPNNKPVKATWSEAFAEDQAKEIQLPDGSAITLNRFSSLRYPDAFPGKKREVFLKGDAYVSVQSNPEKPFSVLTENARVTVLGTRFFVQDQEDSDEVKLYVEEGKVSFDAHKTFNKPEILTNGQEAVLGTDKKISVQQETDLNAYFWKTGRLELENDPLEKVLVLLCFQNKIGLVWEENALNRSCLLTETWEDATLRTVLEDLSRLLDFEYELNENQLRVKHARCPSTP